MKHAREDFPAVICWVMWGEGPGNFGFWSLGSESELRTSSSFMFSMERQSPGIVWNGGVVWVRSMEVWSAVGVVEWSGNGMVWWSVSIPFARGAAAPL
jgi:hypothetical protein